MIADSGYRPFQFGIADLLAVMVIVAVLGATSRLPVSLLQVIPCLPSCTWRSSAFCRFESDPGWHLDFTSSFWRP